MTFLMNKDNLPIVSVVIATYNRHALLPALFASLAAQTLPPTAFEVIIVDDHSLDATTKTVRGLQERSPFAVTYVRQEVNSGPARARNEGVHRARAAIVAFTDDDCLPCPQWLEQALQSFNADVVVGVEGPITTDARRIGAGTHQVANDVPGAFFTANIAYRKDCLFAAGLFDEHFYAPACEDIDLGLRVQQRGRIVFNPHAVVFHPPLPIGLARQAQKIRYCLSDIRLFLKHPSRVTKPYRYLWLYAIRNVVVGICKQQLALLPLFRRDPRRFGAYLVLNLLRLYYTARLAPEYRRRERIERHSLGLEVVW